MDTVGKRLRAAREAQGYTIQQLHELSMVPEDHILEFEADRHFPSFSALAALQNPLQCSAEWLLTGKVPTTHFIPLRRVMLFLFHRWKLI